MIGVPALDADKAVRATEYAGEKRESFLEIVVEADEGLEHGGGEDLPASGTGGSVDGVWIIGGDSDGFGLGLREELEIGVGRSGGGERYAAIGGNESGQGDGDFVIAGEDAGEEILPQVVGDGS